MRLLLFNLVTDESDPVLGFASNWIRALARECEYIDVLTMYRGAHDLPANVRLFSAGRERGLSKARRVAVFYQHLLRLLAARRYDACFAHMMPLFAGLAGPLLRARGIPTVLWYTHRQRSAQLRLGLSMSWRVVTADASSFPYQTVKLRVIGHGIDCEYYTPPPPIPLPGGPVSARPQQDGRGPQALVVQVGRLAAIKHQATTIKAVAGTTAELALVGGVPPAYPRDYERALLALARQLELGARCRFTGDLSAAETRDWLRRATVAVNMSPVGLFDKAALESMACGAPTVVCNPAFAPLLGDYERLLLTAGPDDVAGLRDRLERLFALDDGERAAIGIHLREGVLRAHSLDRLIGRLLAVLRTGELPAPLTPRPPLPQVERGSNGGSFGL